MYLHSYDEESLFGYDIPQHRFATAEEIDVLRRVGDLNAREALRTLSDIAEALNSFPDVDAEIAARDYSEAEVSEGEENAAIYNCTEAESARAQIARRTHGIEEIVLARHGRSVSPRKRRAKKSVSDRAAAIRARRINA